VQPSVVPVVLVQSAWVLVVPAVQYAVATMLGAQPPFQLQPSAVPVVFVQAVWFWFGVWPQ
jgi:hypothetical protein